MKAAESKDEKIIDAAIRKVKHMAPTYFYGDAKDPTLKDRVFHHMPFSSAWSGRALTSHSAWQRKDWSIK